MLLPAAQQEQLSSWQAQAGDQPVHVSLQSCKVFVESDEEFQVLVHLLHDVQQ